MARHLSKKKRSSGVKLFGFIVTLAVAGAASTAGILYWDMNDRIQKSAVDIGSGDAGPVEFAQPVADDTPVVSNFEGAFSVLLVGSDDGNGDAKYGTREIALNDVNILLHVSEDHTKATAISVPRDMFVDVPKCTDPTTEETLPAVAGEKINQTLSRGGLKCVVDTFRELTGEDIDYAAMIQFNGVIALSNAVGGVPVCVSDDIDDPEAGLVMTAGDHTIAGDQALAFLRTRHGVGDGSDLARISNQQVFLSSLMRTLKSKDTLSDPKKVYGIANSVASNMTLSTNLADIPTIASLAYSLKDIPLNEITFLQYPTEYYDLNGVSGVLPKAEAAEEMVEAVFSGRSVTITGGTAPGSIGAVDRDAAPTDSETAAPVETTAPTETAVPAPSAPIATDEPVSLSTDVTGMTASANTCSRGFSE